MENLLKTLENIASGDGYDLSSIKAKEQQQVAVQALLTIDTVLHHALTSMDIAGGHFGVVTDAQEALRNQSIAL